MKADKKSPISEYLLKLQLIITNTTFKDKTEANKYETVEMTDAAQNYIHAKNQTDTFELYKYSQEELLRALYTEYQDSAKINFIMRNIHTMPIQLKKKLKEQARAKVLATYDEPNNYYRMLAGLPNKDMSPVTIPDEFYQMCNNVAPGIIPPNLPVHDLPYDYQNMLIDSPYYEKLLLDNPKAQYLRHIGSKSIPFEISRKARDGDILKIDNRKLSTYHRKFGVITVTPDIIHKFTQVYKETHYYVYTTLRGEFQNIYPNYDSFIRFLTIYLTLGNCMNEFLKSASSMVNMNNELANNLFNLYGLPSVIMEGSSMIDFLKQFRLLLMDKGTNIIYRVKDLIGYDYTEIYSLIMVKQQVFKNGLPVYYYNEQTGEAIPKQRIVFRRMGTTDDSNSYFKFREEDKEYLEREFPEDGSIEGEYTISSGDPRWWETKEVNDALRNMNYTLSNSKYIQLSTHVSLTDIWFQTVILLRGLLDEKINTKLSYININYNMNGVTSISVFDAVLCLLVLMNWKLGLNGEMYHTTDGINCYDMLYNYLWRGQLYESNVEYSKGDLVGLLGDNELYEATKDFRSDGSSQNIYICFNEDISRGNLIKFDKESLSPCDLVQGRPFKIASFNFNLSKIDYDEIKGFEYVEPSILMPLIDATQDVSTINVGTFIMNDVYEIYKHLEKKLISTRTIEEFRQVTDTYNKLFLVNPERDWKEEGLSTVDILQKEYNITPLDYLSLTNAFTKHELGDPDFNIVYRIDNIDLIYPIYLHDVINNDVKHLLLKPLNNDDPLYEAALFNYPKFVKAFEQALDTLKNDKIDVNPSYSVSLKQQHRDIIKTKIEMDLSTEDGELKTFESLLHQTNPILGKFIRNLKAEGNSESIVLFLRSLVKALATYSESNLSALEFRSLGIETYIDILKEVISYFKSYMVEFTKDEFIYMFDNILDNGGNSNILKLFDEFNHKTMIYSPRDSVALFDVSRTKSSYHINDSGFKGFIYDDAIIRLKTTYAKIKAMNYPVWFDDGIQISRAPFSGLKDDTQVIGNLVRPKNSEAYKIIIHKSNVEIDNYYGNKRAYYK